MTDHESQAEGRSLLPQKLGELIDRWRIAANVAEARKAEAMEQNFTPGQDINRAKMLTLRDCADDLETAVRSLLPVEAKR